MIFTNQEQKKTGKVSGAKLEELIANAIRKVGANKENDLCKYLPVSTGGYIHHFTMRKMKTEDPEKLSQMIKEFIIKVDQPGIVAPKPRAARGSRKRRDQPALTKNDLERLLNIARLAGDTEMIVKLTPKKSLSTIKKELIASVRQNVADQELWNSFVEILKLQLAANEKLDNSSLTKHISSELAAAANSALLSETLNR